MGFGGRSAALFFTEIPFSLPELAAGSSLFIPIVGGKKKSWYAKKLGEVLGRLERVVLQHEDHKINALIDTYI